MTLQLYDNQDVHAYNTHCATYTVCLCWDLRRTTTSTYNLYPTLRDTRVKFDFLLKGHAHFRIHITPLISRSFGIPCAVENLWSYTSVISDLHCQGSCGCCFSSDEFHLRVISAITYSVSSSLVDDFWHRAWPRFQSMSSLARTCSFIISLYSPLYIKKWIDMCHYRPLAHSVNFIN